MASLSGLDLAQRSAPVAKRWTSKKKDFKPGGSKGKLHRELGVPEGQKIPAGRLASAQRSDNPEIRRDAVRAKTMEGWKRGGKKKPRTRESRMKALYDNPKDR